MQLTDNIIDISPSAIKKIKKVIADNNEPDKPYLRIGVKGGGCSGLSYILEMDEQKEYDHLLNYDGVEIIVDKRHALYLEGTVLDFKDGLDARGFVFENPKATSTCGCGSSFSA